VTVGFVTASRPVPTPVAAPPLVSALRAGAVARLARFAAVGASGVVVNLVVLAVLLLTGAGAWLPGGDALDAVVASQAAVAWNFTLTERWVFPSRRGHWARRLAPFWVVSCAALAGQLPLAARLQPLLGQSSLLATAAALTVLVLARFAVCDTWLYRHSAAGQGLADAPVSV
jgi:dolichol-phosphate mannosyltransferase